MSATVALAELDAETRQRVAEQIPEAALTVAEQSSVTFGDPAGLTNDQLADIVIEGVKKIRAYLPYIRTLKERFDSGDRDSTNRLKTPIKDCRSWAEFCDLHLDRGDRAIRKALAAQHDGSANRKPKPEPEAPHDPEPQPSTNTEPSRKPGAEPISNEPPNPELVGKPALTPQFPRPAEEEYDFKFFTIRHKASGHFVQGPGDPYLFLGDEQENHYSTGQNLAQAFRFLSGEDNDLFLEYTIKKLCRQRDFRKLHLKPEDFEIVEVRATYRVSVKGEDR